VCVCVYVCVCVCVLIEQMQKAIEVLGGGIYVCVLCAVPMYAFIRDWCIYVSGIYALVVYE
jgi:hypothetical protein